MVFKSMDELFKHIKDTVNNSLENEVTDTVREFEQQHIDDDVYSVYKPKMYKRRGLDGGLIADENIIGYVDESKSTLTVVNATPPNPHALDEDLVTTDKNLPELIEYGDGYNGNNYDFPTDDGAFMYPRPFVENTIDELKNTKEHIKALKEGLKRNGINTK
jgi:hypothetical protein